jgi:sulfide dehydrogenase cytochrome subunit
VAAVCANCHGTDGRNQGAIPAIAGRPARLLGDKLRQFRVDSVSDATVMPRLVKGLSEAEIDQVAAYFAAVR